MKFNLKNLLFLILIVFYLIAFLPMSLNCEYGIRLHVDNQYARPVKITINDIAWFNMPPETKKTIFTTYIPQKPNSPRVQPKYIIKVKNEQGDIVYYEEITWQEWSNRGWTIIIPPE